ncbi:hypothetical protein [Massilia aerilata]|uniref:Uncharacterized protein n=1 Tax=Massilia aerilata TaxID=453817 RepID=A0ABW0RYK1_9BURK
MSVFLPGCAMFTPATESRYVSADGQLRIRGELVDSTSVKIFVNENQIIDEQVSLIRGDGEFAGTWAGKRVSVIARPPADASCMAPPAPWPSAANACASAFKLQPLRRASSSTSWSIS